MKRQPLTQIHNSREAKINSSYQDYHQGQQIQREKDTSEQETHTQSAEISELDI
jgi:hypothetical protein